MWGEQDVVSRHYRRYTKKRLVSALEGAGFRLTFASYFNTLLFPMIAGVRGLKRFIPQKGEAASDFTSIPAAAEPVLGRIFSLEAGLVSRVRLPFGVSLLAIASNPA
jgi:hypothetical protein